MYLQMKNNNIHNFSLFVLLPVGLLFFIVVKWQPSYLPTATPKNTTSHHLEETEKQKGAHVFGRIDSSNISIIKNNNIEWVTLVSWGFQENCGSSSIRHHNGDSADIQQHNENWLLELDFIRSKGFKIFLKPHIWISTPADGKWRSDIYPTDDENWEIWKANYRNFILRYATIAEQANVEMFCIGTEFTKLTAEKPDFWIELIQEVRAVYSGKITYAANWYKEYEKVTFWNELDYIGIQAYFPLTKNEYPTVQEISRGWKKNMKSIASIHKRYHRKVLFTEMGYKSTADSAIRPWEWIEKPSKYEKILSNETQANCYEAFFDTVWKKDWFAGVHIWQIRIDYRKRYSRRPDLDFTPQGKPAEHIIAKGFE